jgi:WD40 repeat protein
MGAAMCKKKSKVEPVYPFILIGSEDGYLQQFDYDGKLRIDFGKVADGAIYSMDFRGDIIFLGTSTGVLLQYSFKTKGLVKNYSDQVKNDPLTEMKERSPGSPSKKQPYGAISEDAPRPTMHVGNLEYTKAILSLTINGNLLFVGCGSPWVKIYGIQEQK